MLREIALEVGRHMMSSLEAGLDDSDDPREQLRGVIHEYTGAVVRGPRSFAVFWLELRSLEPQVRAKLRSNEREFVRRVRVRSPNGSGRAGCPLGRRRRSRR